jgi:hypothetical protein
MIRFLCPGCGATYTVDDSKGGKTGKCPKCQGQFTIPMPEEGAAPSPAPEPAPPPAPAGGNEPVEIAPCPGCQARLSVAPSDVGIDVECPYCKTVYQAKKPGTGTSAPLPPPAPPRLSSLEKAGGRDRRDDEEDERPSRRRRRDEEDDEERPSRRRARARDEDDDDRPSRGPRRRAGGTVVLQRLGVLSTGKVMGIMYAILALIVAIPYGLILLIVGASTSGGPGGGQMAGAMAGMGICMVVLLPVIYGVAGFIGGIIMAALYNVVVRMVGGIEMELD